MITSCATTWQRWILKVPYITSVNRGVVPNHVDLLAESADDAEPSKPAFLKHNVVVWINDEDCLACADCKLLFSFFRRKHHCRACGKVFCGKCTKNAIPLPDFDLHKPERVCFFASA